MTFLINQYGYSLSIDNKDLKDKALKSRTLKDDSIKKVLTFKHQQNQRQKIKIKVEVDTNPPDGGIENVDVVSFPQDFNVATLDIPSLMAGKIHAILCRSFEKGRDWYDLNWYITNKISPNLELLKNALFQMGPWKGVYIDMDMEFLKSALTNKAGAVNWQVLKKDVAPFVRPEKNQSVELWSEEFFIKKISRP